MRLGSKAFAALAFALLPLAACSFDYGERTAAQRTAPDLVMEEVEYVRVRGAEIQARFVAERLERFEARQLMELQYFYFEQFEQGDVSASGRADVASVEIDSNDVRMFGEVRVQAEDIVLETAQLEWRDRQRLLLGGGDEEVRIRRDDGTTMTGVGFRADTRRRSWEFERAVFGTYVQGGGGGEANGAGYGANYEEHAQ